MLTYNTRQGEPDKRSPGRASNRTRSGRSSPYTTIGRIICANYSMNVSDILALARAGFNAQQIAALSGAISSAPAAAPAEPAPAIPAPAATSGPASAPAAPAAPAAAPAAPDATAEILKQLGIISTQLTTNNIMGSNQPAPQTADQILAAIIAPPTKEAK